MSNDQKTDERLTTVVKSIEAIEDGMLQAIAFHELYGIKDAIPLLTATYEVVGIKVVETISKNYDQWNQYTDFKQSLYEFLKHRDPNPQADK